MTMSEMVKKHKAALTRAQKTGDPNTIVAVCDAAFADFDIHGWPDGWSHWERAKNDALMKAIYQ
jgi:hypothetical protein